MVLGLSTGIEIDFGSFGAILLNSGVKRVLGRPSTCYLVFSTIGAIVIPGVGRLAHLLTSKAYTCMVLRRAERCAAASVWTFSYRSCRGFCPSDTAHSGLKNVPYIAASCLVEENEYARRL